MNKEKKRIAILGGGGVGTCAALELANRGYQVDLYEEQSMLVSKASFANEGKIHLGLIYAMDKELSTARHMILGALHFTDYLKRWIDLEMSEMISTPFHYCVHQGSLMSPEELHVHYRRCIELFDEMSSSLKKSYLNLFDRIEIKRLPNSKMDNIANPEFMDAVFLTNEYAVEPRYIAYKLRSAVEQHPAINLRLRTKVESVAINGKDLMVKGTNCSVTKIEERYSDVVNATWNGMLAIDKSMGIEPLTAWSHRYKFGSKILIPFQDDAFPSCTIVQGPFGDTVNFKDRGMFLSWYPIGRTGWSEEYRPPEWDVQLTADQRLDVFQKSLDEIIKRVPSVKSLNFRSQDVDPVGGVIYALGNSDVDDYKSKLHSRFEVGIRSFKNYHSVNTGKYTLIPYLGMKIADRLEQIS